MVNLRRDCPSRVAVRALLGAFPSVVLLAAPTGCQPALNDTLSVVSTPRVLAVRADPAEAAPMTPVAYTALVVDDSGTLSAAPIAWAYCNERKPLAELGPVSPACLTRAADFLQPLGSGSGVSGVVPVEACSQFGSDVPIPKPGESLGRPVDPDPTGGYYQPLTLAMATAHGDAFTFAEQRISCDLQGATSDQLVAFRTRYRLNTNPEVDSLSVNGIPAVPSSASDGNSADARDAGDASAPLVVAKGAHVTLRATWAGCADRTMSCTGAEAYVVYDLGPRTLRDAREGIAVAWFSTAGSFDQDHTGRDESDLTAYSENGWTAPTQPGIAHLWVVIRDDRGGVGWKGYLISVQ